MFKFFLGLFKSSQNKKPEEVRPDSGIIKITVDFNDRRHGGYVSKLPVSPDQTVVQVELLKMLMRALCNFDRDGLVPCKWRGTKFNVEIDREGRVLISQA